MIFVTVGSSTIPFDRLLRAIDSTRFEEHLVVQHGASAFKPRQAECVDFLGYVEFIELVRDARVVVTHAGVGSVMTAVGEGRRPIVVPRLCSHSEAVDDHQVSFARRAGALGLVTLVEDVDTLPAAIETHTSNGAAIMADRSPIEMDLRAGIEEILGPAALTSSEGVPT